MDLREDDLVDPQRHWYYQAKARVVEAELRRHGHGRGALLDLGAGSGFFARYLLDAGVVESAVCVDPGYGDEDLASVAASAGPRGALRGVQAADAIARVTRRALRETLENGGKPPSAPVFLRRVFEALGALVMLAILVFIFGGFIGLLIIGWERLIEVVMPLAEKYLTTITLHMFV